MSYLPESSLGGEFQIVESLGVMNNDAPTLKLVSAPRPFRLAQTMRVVRALAHGESHAVVLFDRKAEREERNGDWSLRLVIARHLTDDDYEADMEVFVGETGEWSSYRGLEDDKSMTHGGLTLSEVPAILAYFAAVADIERRRDEARTTRDPEERRAQDAVAAILALKAGARWAEERGAWGPLYVPGCAIEPENPQYHTHTYRYVVDRRAHDRWGQEFKFTVQVRRGLDGAWGGYDLGMGSHPSDPSPFSRTVRAEGVSAAVALFRSLLDTEATDLRTSPDSLAEREEYDIADEHLRAGTLSEKTMAELAAEAEGLKVAA